MRKHLSSSREGCRISNQMSVSIHAFIIPSTVYGLQSASIDLSYLPTNWEILKRYVDFPTDDVPI